MNQTIGSREILAAMARRVCLELGLRVAPNVDLGHRRWGARRVVDVVTVGALQFGLDCHFQNKGGSAELRVYSLLFDIAHWESEDIRGLVVFGGTGFSSTFLSHVSDEENVIHIDALAAELLRRREILREVSGE